MKKTSSKRGYSLGSLEEVAEEEVISIPLPFTPTEPMEFLSRNWSVSAAEISSLLIKGNNDNAHVLSPVSQSYNPWNVAKIEPSNGHHHHHHHLGITKWFHHNSTAKSKHKEKVRADRARLHAAVSVAGVASAVAAVVLGASKENGNSKMLTALASATELLASHCTEVAEQAGAGRDNVAAAVRSAADVSGPGDLMTLTAAAATALRGAEATRLRAQNNAAVIPYEKTHCNSLDIWCREGDLLERSAHGHFHRKRVSIYINHKSQVMVKIKSNHIGGAFSKKRKSVVYGVVDEVRAEESRSFQLRTSDGVAEFECENCVSKKNWVDGVDNLLRQVRIVS